MPLYESIFVARQDLSKQDVQKLTDQFSAVVKENGGKVVKTEYWGLRNLAYRIQKNRKGHYVLIAMDAPAAAEKEVARQMGINEEIIRTMTVRVEAIEEGPSAILQNRRDDEFEDQAA